MRKAAAIIALVAVALAFACCKAQAADIAGVWISQAGADTETHIETEFTPDGRVLSRSGGAVLSEGRYRIDGRKITIISAGAESHGTFKVKDNSFIIKYEDGEIFSMERAE